MTAMKILLPIMRVSAKTALPWVSRLGARVEKLRTAIGV
jgi:hypothetical protein